MPSLVLALAAGRTNSTAMRVANAPPAGKGEGEERGRKGKEGQRNGGMEVNDAGKGKGKKGEGRVMVVWRLKKGRQERIE